MFQAVTDFARLDIEPVRLKDVLDKNTLLDDLELDNGRTLSRALKLEKEGDVIVAFGQRAHCTTTSPAGRCTCASIALSQVRTVCRVDDDQRDEATMTHGIPGLIVYRQVAFW
jgi:hypothetical protein